MCVFITAVPIIKLFAWGEGCVWLLGQTFQVMSLKRRIAAEVFSPSRRTNSDGEQILSWITRAVQIVAAPSSHSHSSRSPSRRTNWVPLQVWCVHLTFKPLINIHESLVPKDHTNLSWVFIWVFKSAVTVFPLAPRRHQGASTYAHHLLSSSPPPSSSILLLLIIMYPHTNSPYRMCSLYIECVLYC